jgi:hypothetical protein
MGNIIFSSDLITVVDAEITAQSTSSGFSKADVMDLWHLKRRWRMNTADKSAINPIIYFDMGAAKTVTHIMLDDVNFSKVLILGHASDLSTDWTAASFSSAETTISNDAQVNRYKVIIPLTAFNYQWLAICVPSAASAVGSYTTKWEIGRVAILDSVNTFTKNMAYGYVRGAKQARLDLELSSGHRERHKIGAIQWNGTLSFSHRSTTEEADLTTLNNLDIDAPLFFYENNGDTSKCYLCLRDDDYMGTHLYANLLTGSTIRLTELI